MLVRPRYGVVGMLAMPATLAFELLGPVVELTGLGALVVGWWLGVLSAPFLVAFTLVALVFGLFLSVSALALEELSLRRYPHLRQLAGLVVYSVFEQLGYRQLHAAWRVWAIVRWLRGKREWGEMHRRGLASAGA
jgi:Zn-dependent protease with chaperone function